MLGGDSDDIPSRVETLHLRLKEDYTMRWELDCYLLALYYNPTRPPKWMILDICDTYHYHNLPDLMHVVRSTLMGQCCSPWLQRLFNMFLCGKRYRRLSNTNDQNCQLTAAIINTLHGLLLGLYPFNERRSDFQKRSWIAGNMHAVLTQKKHTDFIMEHPNLLCLSLIEYILNVVHDFCPVEWSLLGVSTGAKSQCLSAMESFRENTVNACAGAEDFWTRTEVDAAPVVNILSKFFRETALYQHRSRSVIPASMLAHLPLALQTQVIQNSSSIFGQLKCALPAIQFRESEALEEIWNSIYIRQLPSHTTCNQMQSLDKLGRMCSLVENELHHLPMCLACALTRRADVLKSLFRYDTVERRLVCKECMGYQCVVNINMLGRVLFVRDKVIVLCEHCLRPKYWDSPCGCLQVDTHSADTCCVCNTQNIVSSKQVIDIKTIQMKTVHFCYKHSLSCVINEATVYDFHALEQELKHRTLKPN